MIEVPGAAGERMARAAQGPDWFGRSVGLIGFFVGIGLLVVVFVLTTIWLGELKPPAGVKVDYWAQHGATMVVRISQLFIMGFVASWIAGRGAQMYAAANRWFSSEA
jgi:hypothetical protein